VDVARTPAHRFVTFLQNHDQVGNRAAGDRNAASLSPALLKIGAALLLLGPFTPMLFMGEEWAASTPWRYFTDHREPELGRAVTEGRRREFARHGWTGEVPDPQAVDTFRRSRLDWAEAGEGVHRELLEWHRALITLRRAWPELTDPRLAEVAVDLQGDMRAEARNERDDVDARVLVLRRGRVHVAACFDERILRLPVVSPARMLLASGAAVRLDPATADGGRETAALTLPGPAVAVFASPSAP
jgi:maltooligosyltrehalose trehalohydrolase